MSAMATRQLRLDGNGLSTGAAITQKLLLTPRETAAILSISERTLWAMTQRGDNPNPAKIPCVRVGQTGRSVRYDPVALAEWVASHRGTNVQTSATAADNLNSALSAP